MRSMKRKTRVKKYAYANKALNVVSKWINGTETLTYPHSASKLAPFEANARKIAHRVGGEVGQFYLTVANAIHQIRSKLSEVAKKYGIHASRKMGKGTSYPLPRNAVVELLESTGFRTAYKTLVQLAQLEPNYVRKLRQVRKRVKRKPKAMEMC